MSSLSPIAQNPAMSNLANLILAASFPKLSLSPSQMQSVNLSHLSGSVTLPVELDQAVQGIGMAAVSVKQQHLSYLRDFRTQQCPLFANHKCTQHKPFTCFHWHFPNQRRRRPIRKSDGTFSYSPDVYCDKYDETRGDCPNGDACPYLHRNAGDTERRYHLRYFKTGTCIHDTDARGQCTRNGSHCAFAHGAQDLRVPVYDIREVQEAADCPVNLPASLEKERVLSEDPKWNEMSYVLANYKTEQCRKPPRMCRQGYACPFFHNAKDKRRGPQFYKYRSTPCPAVKSSDEWLDSSLCEQSDDCQYCHTRTEQQFHPEIYKSTKCNDVVQQSYCPRGPFCAFAHEESEMNFGRNFIQEMQELHSAGDQLPAQLSGLSPLTLSRLIGTGWDFGGSGGAPSPPGAGLATGRQQHLHQLHHSPVGAAAAAAAAVVGNKGRTYSGASVASAESGLGSLHRGDSPAFHARFSTSTSTSSGRNSAVATASAAAAAAAAAAATYASASSGGMSNLPADLDELDFLSQPDGVGTACSQSSDSFSPLTVLTSTASGPLGIPGATSPYSPSAFRSTVSSHGSAAVGPLPFQSGAGGTFEAASGRHRMNSDQSSAMSPNFAQSPILISSSSPFANPGVDLERLQFQQEILRAQDEARRMREAMQRAQQERDDAQRQLESVRAQLRDISALAEQHSQSKDLLSLSAEELEELKQKLHRHLQTAQQLTLEDSSPPRQPGVTSASGGGGLNLSASIDSLGFSAALSTVEELSGDVTPNPGASESASLNNSVNNRFVFSRDSLQMKEQQINQQSVQSDKVEQQDKAKAEQSEQLEIS
ncbi:hypothetical protein BOX15_Mlig031142g1 [Macrostomum lignano]|uniref:C3H1-type domain-containing protein n=1 Tax=Macrostomum lignano TaxID=282301 RepID=A0A267EXA5_9PLAT|nr:hypothetical protein BOX15_Mlig031142g1 [Macrostomum lignano]